jgi:hypothetical protein
MFFLFLYTGIIIDKTIHKYMKYSLLNKNQWEELHEEFARFLAVRGIDKTAWDAMKSSNDSQVRELMEGFSDLVWDEVLKRTEFLSLFQPESINLFRCEKDGIHRIVIQTENKEVDFTTEKGLEWFMEHSRDKSIKYFKGYKAYSSGRNEELYKMILNGAQLSDGKLYKAVELMISPD